MTDLFAALDEEAFRDPIVHAHLCNYRHGNVSERDMLIALVKDLSRANAEGVKRLVEFHTYKPVPMIIVKEASKNDL
jgi:hypothetical protein